MIKSPKMPLIILLSGLLGCAGGNTKVPLTPDEIIRLKNESTVYFSENKAPEFIWWTTNILGGSVRHSLHEIRTVFDVSISLKEINVSLKEKIIDILQNQYEFKNIRTVENNSGYEDQREFRERLEGRKKFDLKTNFWQLWPTRSYLGLEPEEAFYQFQYSGVLRLIDLNSGKVMHQHLCYYPWKGRLVGLNITPPVEGSWLGPVSWELEADFSALVANQGKRLHYLIDIAIDHCAQEFINDLLGVR